MTKNTILLGTAPVINLMIFQVREFGFGAGTVLTSSYMWR